VNNTRERAPDTQGAVYAWLIDNPGEHIVSEIAEGTGLDRVQAGNACTNLKKKGAVANHGNAGFNTKWFALPGVELTPRKTGDDVARGAQKMVYDWLINNSGEHATPEIADSLGFTESQVSSALTNLKKKGAAIKTGDSIYTRWVGVPGVDLGVRASMDATRPHKGASPGAIAKLKFEKALEAFIDAAVEIKDYIVVEDQQAELDRLRAFEAQVMQAMPKRGR